MRLHKESPNSSRASVEANLGDILSGALSCDINCRSHASFSLPWKPFSFKEKSLYTNGGYPILYFFSWHAAGAFSALGNENLDLGKIKNVNPESTLQWVYNLK